MSDFKVEESLDEMVKLVSIKACSETGEVPESTITLMVNDEEKSASSDGGGPVDASFKAIEKIIASQANLQLYSVSNVTQGTDSLGEVAVRLEKAGRIVNGHGADTDIVVASAKAYINALNRLLSPTKRVHPQAFDGI